MLMKLFLALVFVVTSPLTSVIASAQQSDRKLNATEQGFEQLLSQRYFPFGGLHEGREHLLHVEALLATGNLGVETKDNALRSAVSYGDIELLQLLIRHGANVNQEVENRLTILMIAAAHGFYVQCGNDPLVTSYTGNTAAVAALLDAGSRLDAKNNEGETALMLAARHARSGSVELLLSAGANVNLTNAHGETALMHAVEASGGYAEDNVNEIVKRLISAGADLNARDEQGKTALGHAPRSGAVTKMLIEAGAIE